MKILCSCLDDRVSRTMMNIASMNISCRPVNALPHWNDTNGGPVTRFVFHALHKTGSDNIRCVV